MTTTLFAFVLGASVGMLTGFFGAGGGFILTPALNLALGLDMVHAVGTGAAQVCIASGVTLLQRLDRRLTGLSVALWCALGTLPGNWAGGSIVDWLEGKGRHVADVSLLSIFAVLLLAIIVLMLGERRGNAATERPGLLQGIRIPPYCASPALRHGRFSIPVLVALGVVMGLGSGLLGIGGGVLMLPMMLYFVGLSGHAATLTTTVLVFLSACISAVLHQMAGHVNTAVFVPLVLGALPGTFLGSRLEKRCATARLKGLFVWVVAAAWLIVVAKLLAGAKK